MVESCINELIGNVFGNSNHPSLQQQRKLITEQKLQADTTVEKTDSLSPGKKSPQVITAFCTRNLFRDSKQLKSNFIRLAENTDADVTCQTYQQSDIGLLMMTKAGMKESSGHSLSERLSGKDWPTLSKRQSTKSSDELNVNSECSKTTGASIPSQFSSFTAYGPDKSNWHRNSFSEQPEYNILATRPLQPVAARRQKVNKFVRSSSNALGHRAELKISEQPVLEKTLKEIEQNKKINEYLVEMSSYYMEIQPSVQFRS